MNGIGEYYDHLLAEYQRKIDKQAYEEEEREKEMDKLKAQIIELLEDNHPNELADLTGADEDTCLKIVHQLLSKDPNDWEPERSGGIWAIYGKTFSAEWIDENGDYLGFDTKREAMEYIQKEIK
jgi:hypothetical protein